MKLLLLFTFISFHLFSQENRYELDTSVDVVNDQYENAFTLYNVIPQFSKKQKVKSYIYESEFDPTPDYIQENGFCLKDSVKVKIEVINFMLDTLQSVRQKLGLKDFTFYTDVNDEFIEECKFYYTIEKQNPVMFIDKYRSCGCNCFSELMGELLTDKDYRKILLSKRLKSIELSAFFTNEEKIYVFFKTKQIFYKENLLILE